MINEVGQIMLYVNDQEATSKFWEEKLGFQIVSAEDNGQGMKWIEMAPSKDAQTTIVLHDKQLIASLEPELHLGTPSLMFYTEDIDTLFKEYTNKNIQVGDLVNMPGGRVFNFADNEGNYFAVMEKRK